MKRLGCCDLVEKNMLTCVILKPCEITNVIYFVVLGGHYPLFDEKEKIFTVISSLEKFII